MGKSHHASRGVLAAVAAAMYFSLAAPPARADLIVDTGVGGNSDIGSDSLFNDVNKSGSFQYLAGQFTLNGGAIIDRVDGWFGPFASGAMNVKIYSNDNALPGTPIYSSTGAVPPHGAGGSFGSFGSLHAALPAGTYWLSFEPTPTGGFVGTMPGGAATPLPKYAYYADGNNRWVAQPAGTSHNLGMRVDGRASSVYVGSAAKGTYREDVPINGDPNGLTATGGGNGHLTTEIGVGNGAGRGTIVNGFPEVGALARGFTDASGGPSVHSGTGTGHGIAWTPFFNNTGQPQTFNFNSILDGQASNTFGALNCHVDALVAAFDAKTLGTRIVNSGQDAGDYLLGLHTAPGQYSGLAANGLLGGKVLNDLFSAGNSGVQPKSYALQTGPIVLAPGDSMILMFDVYVDATGQSGSGGGTGTVDFLHTLHAAAVPFTDAAGQPVTGIVPGMGNAIAVPEPASVGLLFGAAAAVLGRRRGRRHPAEARKSVPGVGNHRG